MKLKETFNLWKDKEIKDESGKYIKDIETDIYQGMAEFANMVKRDGLNNAIFIKDVLNNLQNVKFIDAVSTASTIAPAAPMPNDVYVKFDSFGTTDLSLEVYGKHMNKIDNWDQTLTDAGYELVGGTYEERFFNKQSEFNARTKRTVTKYYLCTGSEDDNSGRSHMVYINIENETLINDEEIDYISLDTYSFSEPASIKLACDFDGENYYIVAPEKWVLELFKDVLTGEYETFVYVPVFYHYSLKND